MLAIRMQRIGRKGHAMFRVVVQDSRLTPTSGKFVAQLGSYDPHAKVSTLDKEKASFYLDHGAQPSDRVARLFQGEGVKLPSWVKTSESKTGKLRNPEKLRKNQPKEEKPVEAETPTETQEEATEEAKA
jgi:small subunit ribosomal protein S16